MSMPLDGEAVESSDMHAGIEDMAEHMVLVWPHVLMTCALAADGNFDSGSVAECGDDFEVLNGSMVVVGHATWYV